MSWKLVFHRSHAVPIETCWRMCVSVCLGVGSGTQITFSCHCVPHTHTRRDSSSKVGVTGIYFVPLSYFPSLAALTSSKLSKHSSNMFPSRVRTLLRHVHIISLSPVCAALYLSLYISRCYLKLQHWMNSVTELFSPQHVILSYFWLLRWLKKESSSVVFIPPFPPKINH